MFAYLFLFLLASIIDLRFEDVEYTLSTATFTAQVAHMKGTVVKSSHIFQGWSVNPQLENAPWRCVAGERTDSGCWFLKGESYGKRKHGT
jgi:hypothetical protein